MHVFPSRGDLCRKAVLLMLLGCAGFAFFILGFTGAFMDAIVAWFLLNVVQVPTWWLMRAGSFMVAHPYSIVVLVVALVALEWGAGKKYGTVLLFFYALLMSVILFIGYMAVLAVFFALSPWEVRSAIIDMQMPR